MKKRKKRENKKDRKKILRHAAGLPLHAICNLYEQRLSRHAVAPWTSISLSRWRCSMKELVNGTGNAQRSPVGNNHELLPASCFTTDRRVTAASPSVLCSPGGETGEDWLMIFFFRLFLMVWGYVACCRHGYGVKNSLRINWRVLFNGRKMGITLYKWRTIWTLLFDGRTIWTSLFNGRTMWTSLYKGRKILAALYAWRTIWTILYKRGKWILDLVQNKGTRFFFLFIIYHIDS